VKAYFISRVRGIVTIWAHEFRHGHSIPHHTTNFRNVLPTIISSPF
jgi:hypothetical protein